MSLTLSNQTSHSLALVVALKGHSGQGFSSATSWEHSHSLLQHPHGLLNAVIQFRRRRLFLTVRGSGFAEPAQPVYSGIDNSIVDDSIIKDSNCSQHFSRRQRVLGAGKGPSNPFILKPVVNLISHNRAACDGGHIPCFLRNPTMRKDVKS